MKAFREYWTFSAIRGAMTMLAALAILAVPWAAVWILSLPVLLALAIDCVATYSLLDAGAIFLLGTAMPGHTRGGRAYFALAGAAIVGGALLVLVGNGIISPQALMWVVAAQAALAAVVEWTAARETHRNYACLSCYASAIVLTVAAFALPFATGLSAENASLALAAYVGTYGLSQVSLGGRMLFLEYRSEHPASAASEAWRGLMTVPVPVVFEAEAEACENCAECRKDAPCRIFTMPAQGGRLVSAREPAIVRTVRMAGAMTPAGAYRGR